MIAFIVFLAVMFLMHIILVLPNSPGSIYSYCMSGLHAFLWSTVSISFLMSSCRDPGFLKKEYEVLHLLEHFHPDDICPRCEVLTTPRS